VISKEAAGEHARRIVDRRWHPLLDEALAYWRAEPSDPRLGGARRRSAETGAFVLEVARAAAAP